MSNVSRQQRFYVKTFPNSYYFLEKSFHISNYDALIRQYIMRAIAGTNLFYYEGFMIFMVAIKTTR